MQTTTCWCLSHVHHTALWDMLLILLPPDQSGIDVWLAKELFIHDLELRYSNWVGVNHTHFKYLFVVFGEVGAIELVGTLEDTDYPLVVGTVYGHSEYRLTGGSGSTPGRVMLPQLSCWDVDSLEQWSNRSVSDWEGAVWVGCVGHRTRWYENKYNPLGDWDEERQRGWGKEEKRWRDIERSREGRVGGRERAGWGGSGVGRERGGVRAGEGEGRVVGRERGKGKGDGEGRTHRTRSCDVTQNLCTQWRFSCCPAFPYFHSIIIYLFCFHRWLIFKHLREDILQDQGQGQVGDDL